jgi:hypothetical protein
MRVCLLGAFSWVLQPERPTTAPSVAPGEAPLRVDRSDSAMSALSCESGSGSTGYTLAPVPAARTAGAPAGAPAGAAGTVSTGSDAWRDTEWAAIQFATLRPTAHQQQHLLHAAAPSTMATAGNEAGAGAATAVSRAGLDNPVAVFGATPPQRPSASAAAALAVPRPTAAGAGAPGPRTPGGGADAASPHGGGKARRRSRSTIKRMFRAAMGWALGREPGSPVRRPRATDVS